MDDQLAGIFLVDSPIPQFANDMTDGDVHVLAYVYRLFQQPTEDVPVKGGAGEGARAQHQAVFERDDDGVLDAELFPICDSKIYAFVFNEKPHNYRVSQVSKYRHYLAQLGQLRNDSRFPQCSQLSAPL